MTNKGYKHYQGHQTENYDKTSSTGRNIGRYIKLKFLFKFIDTQNDAFKQITGFQLSDNTDVKKSSDSPLKQHLLKNITGVISNKKFHFKSKGIGKESTFVGILKTEEIILEGSMFDEKF